MDRARPPGGKVRRHRGDACQDGRHTQVVAFGALDAIIQPAVLRELWIIRYGIITPYLVLLLGATYVPGLRPYLEWGLLGVIVVAGRLTRHARVPGPTTYAAVSL